MSKKIFINKKLLTILTILSTIFISLSTCLNPIYPNTPHKKRILQKREFNSDSIYYFTKFLINNVTGTGDKLLDVAYRSVCYVKNCATGCCIGNINVMKCGDTIECKTYEDHVYYLVAVPAVLIPICILCFIFFFMLIFTKRNKYSFCKSLILAVICMAIITIPYVLYYARNAPTKKKKKEKK